MEYKMVVLRRFAHKSYEKMSGHMKTCNDENRPYPGDGGHARHAGYRAEIRDGVLYYYICPDSDLERLEGIPMLKIAVDRDDRGASYLYLSPRKYTEGKRCTGPRGTFYMGDIIEETNAYEAAQQTRDESGWGMASCDV